MALIRKQIAFDLDTNALKLYYPTESWHGAYEVIKRHMTANGFLWQQGSVYVSEKSMSSINATKIIVALVKKNPWLNVCMRDCLVANIGAEHSQNYLFNKNARIPMRLVKRSSRHREEEDELEL